MGAVTEIAQSVAESLLGKNAAGFTEAMKRRQQPATGDTSTDSTSGKTPKRQLNIDTAVRKLKGVDGATGTQEAQAARKGAKIRKSGRVKLHRGESVVRSKNRRGCNR